MFVGALESRAVGVINRMMFPLFTSPADLWLFAFSVVGLLLVPAALGRLAGGVVAGFGVVGLVLIAEPELPPALQPSQSSAIWFLMTLVPFLLLIPDLFARGRAARVLDALPTRALIAWSLVHAVGVRHILSALQGDLPPLYALGLAAGEFFTVLGALFLWFFFRPEARWFRILALFWNAQALLATLELAVGLQRAHPAMPFLFEPSPEVFAYFAAWPGNLEALFWVPLMLCLHAALFYKLLRPQNEHSQSSPHLD